jgi:signal transduction histidine kinase
MSSPPAWTADSWATEWPDGWIRLDLAGGVVGYDPRFFQLWGFSDAEVAALRAADPIARRSLLTEYTLACVLDQETAAAGIRRQLGIPGEVTFEDVALKDGRILECYGVPLRDGASRLAGRVISLRDVTARRQADVELRERARQQAAIAELGKAAIDSSEIDPLLAEAIRIVAQTLGADVVHLLEITDRGAMLALRFGRVVGAADPERVDQARSPAAVAAAHGSTVVVTDLANEVRFVPGGHARNYAAGVSVLVRNRARPFGVLCAHWSRPRGVTEDEVHFLETVADVLTGALARIEAERERHEMQARLAVADRMASVGTLAAGVAHELNNPLAYVSANLAYVAEALQRAPEGPLRAGTISRRDLVQAVEDAQQGASKMRSIIQDLRTFCRQGGDRTGPVDLQPVLQSCVSMAWNEMKRRARFVRDLQDVPKVLGNEGRLGQVFLNLLVNAAQAISEGGADRNVIRLATRQLPDGRVSVEVTDTGSGIPPEVQRRVFDPFFTTKPVGVGTGLGLSICHNIVSSLGGSIEVESAPGRGATFRVLLQPAEAVVVTRQVLVES